MKSSPGFNPGEKMKSGVTRAGNINRVLTRALVIREGKQMIKVKVIVRIETSPSLVVAFFVKSLNEKIRVLKPKTQEAKTFGTHE